jgi:hypothetical protein
LERESDRRTTTHRTGETLVSRKEAEKVARDWFRWAGKRPTKAQIEKAVRHPKVIAETERRAAVGKISN